MPPKKRGRKPKKTKVAENEPKKVHKKRGRKPKGGKIIKKINEKINENEIKKPNIILQLRPTQPCRKIEAASLVDKEFGILTTFSEG